MEINFLMPYDAYITAVKREFLGHTGSVDLVFHSREADRIEESRPWLRLRGSQLDKYNQFLTIHKDIPNFTQDPRCRISPASAAFIFYEKFVESSRAQTLTRRPGSPLIVTRSANSIESAETAVAARLIHLKVTSSDMINDRIELTAGIEKPDDRDLPNNIQNQSEQVDESCQIATKIGTGRSQRDQGTIGKNKEQSQQERVRGDTKLEIARNASRSPTTFKHKCELGYHKYNHKVPVGLLMNKDERRRIRDDAINIKKRMDWFIRKWDVDRSRLKKERAQFIAMM